MTNEPNAAGDCVAEGPTATNPVSEFVVVAGDVTEVHDTEIQEF
jgi:hypothetical protein